VLFSRKERDNRIQFYASDRDAKAMAFGAANVPVPKGIIDGEEVVVRRAAAAHTLAPDSPPSWRPTR